ncbi:hypothetical protein [Streptomyces sp. NPDC005374]|uniref:hypothetical protein n=1 Tax=Streptomyces sp. NPDC005374 TaxID=3364713 RepID=UPI0036CEAD8F
MSVMVDISSLHRSLGPPGSGGPTGLSDEPVSALGPGLAGEVLDVIKVLADQRTTMIVEQGAPAEVLDNPRPEPARASLPEVL